jgi:membrane protease subunit (stomatin/prohibitin family)
MGLWDLFKGEFIDVSEWLDDSNDTMIYRFERHKNEIKYGAKLTVRESQIAVFINEGQIADVLTPGLYELETKNLPILSTLQHWDHLFESPFKAEVYFVNTKRFVDQKWGTKNPIMLRDVEFGMVRLRTFGTYSFRVDDAAKFIKEIAGTDGHFTTDEISHQLRNLITSRFANVIGKSGLPVLDMAGNYDQLGEFVTQRIGSEFDEYGLKLIRVLIENISLPQAVEEALDKRTSMGMVGNLDNYLKYQASESLGKEGGNNSAMEMGMGIAMAQKMADALNQPSQTSTTTQPSAPQVQSRSSAPPPLPQQIQWHVSIDQQAAGPYDRAEIKALISKNKVTKASLVWTEGMDNWQAAETVDKLAGLFRSNTPPPLP